MRILCAEDAAAVDAADNEASVARRAPIVRDKDTAIVRVCAYAWSNSTMAASAMTAAKARDFAHAIINISILESVKAHRARPSADNNLM